MRKPAFLKIHHNVLKYDEPRLAALGQHGGLQPSPSHSDVEKSILGGRREKKLISR